MGKPRFGVLFSQMSRSRAEFKRALRFCRQHEEQLKLDACESSFDFKDSKGFWNSIYNVGNNACKHNVTNIGNAFGDKEIANMWKSHFFNIYNELHDDVSQKQFYDRIADTVCNSSVSLISVQNVVDAVNKQHKNKAAGPDCIKMETFLYGNMRLYIHLTQMFNMFITHGYLPETFMNSTIIPLIKNRAGNVTDVNNYRAIAISNSISKIFETVLLDKLIVENPIDAHQFGFTSGVSTEMCTYVLKNTVKYYNNRGSDVFACFVDFSKAFDKVNYWKLFNKLLDDNVNVYVARLLAFWYSKQDIRVSWSNVLSNCFKMSNGTRQGSVISPYLFARYIRDLVKSIKDTRVGCNLGGCFVNILCYADDIVLLAPSWRALQALLDCLDSQILLIDMQCNTNKTCCMIFTCSRRSYGCDAYPKFTVSGSALQFVQTFKYL